MIISIIIGARPNFIKLAPLIKEIEKNKKFTYRLIHTGQHYDYKMSQIFFKDLKLPKPNYNLGIGSGSHSYQTGKVMIELEKFFLKEKPDIVVVLGDVNSTLAGALVSAKLDIPVAHIEAGVRSFNKKMPEEINRILTDHISSFLFCPTETAVYNLKKEGIAKGVYKVGDIMYDVFKLKIKDQKSKILQKLKLKPKTYLLLTLHRPQNVDNIDKLKNILSAINETGEKIVFPIHPRTKKMLHQLPVKNYQLSNINIIEPVGYSDMLTLEKNAKKILTDSGGIQKESYWCKVPCITLREETEWPETVQSGWNILVGSNKKKIINAIISFSPSSNYKKIFGNGNASKKIIKVLESVYK